MIPEHAVEISFDGGWLSPPKRVQIGSSDTNEGEVIFLVPSVRVPVIDVTEMAQVTFEGDPQEMIAITSVGVPPFLFLVLHIRVPVFVYESPGLLREWV